MADGSKWHAGGAWLLDAPQRTRAESGPSLFTAYCYVMEGSIHYESLITFKDS
jgi:hypothetical protein